jgi:hypothetical protein
MSFVAKLFLALIQPIFTWYAQRKANKEYVEEQAMRTKALTDGDAIRDQATAQEEVSHDQTDSALAHLHDDAGQSQRVQSGDVNAAISAADRDVR